MPFIQSRSHPRISKSFNLFIYVLKYPCEVGRFSISDSFNSTNLQPNWGWNVISLLPSIIHFAFCELHAMISRLKRKYLKMSSCGECELWNRSTISPYITECFYLDQKDSEFSELWVSFLLNKGSYVADIADRAIRLPSNKSVRGKKSGFLFGNNDDYDAGEL